MSTTTKLEMLKRYDYLLKFAWECAAPPCPTNGSPHPGHPYPHARVNQLPPSDFEVFLRMCGRGEGKTRSGAEWVKKRMLAFPNTRVAIIAPDFGVARDVCVEGSGSGLRGLFDGDGVIPWEYFRRTPTSTGWNRSLGEGILNNGSQFKLFGCDTRKDAESIRGYQAHIAWIEELGVARYGGLALDMLDFALRLGDNPQTFITTTPRPIPVIRELIKDAGTVVSRGTTYDNAANLPEKQLARIKRKHEGTTLGRQELFGELLEESEGALWKFELIRRVDAAPEFVRVVIAVDPAGSHKPTSDETGIGVVGMDEHGKLYVLADKSGRYSPEQWAKIVEDLYDEFFADSIVVERNYGGDLVKGNMRNRNRRLPVHDVHAREGKKLRAEPVLGLYERQLVFHVGTFADLETQMTTHVFPGAFDLEGEPIEPSPESPDRVDWLVYAATELALKPRRSRTVMSMGARGVA